MALVHQVIPVGPLQANCYLIADEASKSALVIDPGDEPEIILAAMGELGVKPTHLLHTHCHFDHMTGTRQIHEETGASIRIHPSDRYLYDDLKGQYGKMMSLFGVSLGDGFDAVPADGELADGASIPIGKSTLKILHTPGHTPGSCSFLLEGPDGPRLYTGDTLFAGSIGRTDLEGGDEELEHESIRTRLYTLDPETPVFPGHGPATSIDRERQFNPFARG